jgi:hypothetical protein
VTNEPRTDITEFLESARKTDVLNELKTWGEEFNAKAADLDLDEVHEWAQKLDEAERTQIVADIDAAVAHIHVLLDALRQR